MINLRNLKYLERYENVVFDLDAALVTIVANGTHQKKDDGYRFVVDNSGELRWLRLTGLMRDSASTSRWTNWLMEQILLLMIIMASSIACTVWYKSLKMNRREVYYCNNANHVVIIKNLLEYSPVYAQSTATNEFN